MNRYFLSSTTLLIALGAPLFLLAADNNGLNSTPLPASPTAAAQATGQGGTLQGSVTDPSGSAIAGADVILTNGVTSYNQSVKSQPDGSYRFVNIPLNTYTLEVQNAGFQKFTQTVNVRTQVPIQQNVALVLAGTQQTINVEATPDTVENVPTSHVDVSQALMADLPVTSAGSGLNEIITITSPGVVADSNGFFHPQGDHGETSYNVDGFTIGDQQSKTFSTQLPSNAFQSLELLSTAPDAEFGGKTSLVVNATTRSGMGQPPHISLDTYYGSFGTEGEDFTLSTGGANWGNFFLIDTSNTGRFLDTPEFSPIHDHGNSESIFDRIDYQPGARDALHLNIFGARNWFQIPDTYDQPNQDQRQEARTFSFSLGYQHTFSTKMLLTISPFVRQDKVDYYPSDNPFADSPATLGQNRHLTNWGTRVDFSYASGIHNFKIGSELQQTRLVENFALGITDPTFNAICLTATGDAVTNAALLNASQCAAAGYAINTSFSPGLLPFDLTRGGHLFHFHGASNINQQAVYAQDQITIKNLTINAGLRYDNYEGISEDKLLQPRLGISYLIKATGTVLQASYTRALETPYNENLILSSETGAGGLATNVFGGASTPLRPGHRNQYSTGIEQGIKKYVQIEASYFWKLTKDAFDFDTLLNTSVAFPIEWRESKIDGVNLRISTSKFHGFQAYSTLGHTRARFFGPESGGLIFNSALQPGVFRIDHDQNIQQTTFVRYQHGKDGWWAVLTWRFDSGEVAGSVTDLADALALTGDQQASIGFYCGSSYASLNSPITSCNSTNYGATRIVIPAPGTFNPDHNPPRIAIRNLLDASVGTDNLFHKEKLKTELKLSALNLTNEKALYNFLSTFSGTHWVTPRSMQVTLGWVY